MFTGIIETIGTVTAIEREESNIHFTIQSAISHQLKIDQSIAHNGVCLTVIGLSDTTHTVTAIHETLLKSNIGQLKTGGIVNLERCMPANGRFDGHIVQGHVDHTASCKNIVEQEGSYLVIFEFEKKRSRIS